MGPLAPSVRRPAQVSPSRRPHCCSPPNSTRKVRTIRTAAAFSSLLYVRVVGPELPTNFAGRQSCYWVVTAHANSGLRRLARPPASAHKSHRERRRRMAKPCCDHRDRTLCRCIDVPHVCQYPGAIGPNPNAVPSCICPAAGPRNNHGFAGGTHHRTTPTIASPAPANRKSWADQQLPAHTPATTTSARGSVEAERG
jgi:hypothetical protein